MTTDALPSTPGQEHIGYSQSVRDRSHLPRLGFPIVVVALFWIGHGFLKLIDLSAVHRFMSGMVLFLLLVLCVGGWWLFGRGRRWAEKLGIFALVIVAGIAAAVVSKGAVSPF